MTLDRRQFLKSQALVAAAGAAGIPLTEFAAFVAEVVAALYAASALAAAVCASVTVGACAGAAPVVSSTAPCTRST